MTIFIKRFPLVLILVALLFSACEDDSSSPSVTIAAVEPAMGLVGTQVTITGENFGEDVSNTKVFFNGKEASILSGTPTELVALVPAGATTGPVSVSNGSANAEGPKFVVLKEEVDLGDFSDSDGLIGLATGFQFEDRYRLTSAKTNRTGVVYYGAKLNVSNGFETTFDFVISDPGGIEDGEGKTGADGLAFLIQNQSADAIGNQGGSLGYANIENSLAIEFDTFANTPESDFNNGETNGNHISIHTNGTEANNPAIRFSIAYNDEIPELMDGAVHTVRITYSENKMQVYIDDMTTPAIDTEVDLDTLLSLDEGRAWVGFSSSTGQAYANHDILSWTFDPEK